MGAWLSHWDRIQLFIKLSREVAWKVSYLLKSWRKPIGPSSMEHYFKQGSISSLWDQISPFCCWIFNSESLSFDKLFRNLDEISIGLGCCPGKYRIDITADIKPFQHAFRRLQVLLRERLKMFYQVEKLSLTVREAQPTLSCNPNNVCKSHTGLKKLVVSLFNGSSRHPCRVSWPEIPFSCGYP